MKNFVAYHKIAEWGPYESDGSTEFRHYSGHPQSKLEKTIGQNVWVISGTKTQKQTIYKLCAVYQPSHIEALPEGGFEVVGEGTEFTPQIDLSRYSWLAELLKEQRNFSYGLNEIRNTHVIDGLQSTSQKTQASLLVSAEIRLVPKPSKDIRKRTPVPIADNHIEDIVHRLVPEQYWKDVLGAVGASIELAHACGPDRWGIRLASDSIMLKVGRHEILQLGNGDSPFHLIVDRNTVPMHLRGHSDLWFSKEMDCYGNYSPDGYYSSNPGSEACNMQFENLRNVYQELYHSHEEIVARAAKRSKHPSTRSTHSEALVRFIAKEIGKVLPQPTYLDTPEISQISIFAEEISNDGGYIEGAAKQVLVNAYERNPVARAICIQHYGCQCVVCGMNFEKTYGEIGVGFIHVHHLVEISTIGEEYKVDPINDLRPVCPNCHAMLHSDRPALTIEELKSLLDNQQSG